MGRILFIDDVCLDDNSMGDRPSYGSLLEHLAAAGHRVEHMHDWRQAVAWLEHEYVDVVLVETSVPHICGLEALSKIRQIDARVPLIAMAGGPQRYHAAYLSAAMGCGAYYAFGAPYEQEALLKAVKAGIWRAKGTKV
jgi:DNA-binding NtrC family response regulator